MAYVAYTGGMIKLMIERGIEVAISVLTKVENSYAPPVSLSQTILLELSEGSPIGREE